MQDQKKLWTSSQLEDKIRRFSTKPSDFVKEVLEMIAPHSHVLELGCGIGNDALAFAKSGHTIVATDFSEVAIEKASNRFANIPSLSFKNLDMNKPFMLEDNSFDVVYARLSLHYFTDKVTRNIIKEIYRILKPQGYLCFVCKSVEDYRYEKGEKIEKDMFALEGHVRHFFSEEYVQSLLKEHFTIIKMESGFKTFYIHHSGFVKVIAQVK